MAPIILDEDAYNHMEEGQVATLRIYVAESIKRGVVIKEDHIFTKKELSAHQDQVAKATMAELQTWLQNECFAMLTEACTKPDDLKMCCHMETRMQQWSLELGYQNEISTARIYGYRSPWARHLRINSTRTEAKDPRK